MIWILFAITCVFGLLRFVLPVEGKINKKDIFKDLAHLWAAYMFAFATYQSEWVYVSLPILLILRFVLPNDEKIDFKNFAHLWVGYLFGLATIEADLAYWSLPVGITILEVVAFIVRKK